MTTRARFNRSIFVCVSAVVCLSSLLTFQPCAAEDIDKKIFVMAQSLGEQLERDRAGSVAVLEFTDAGPAQPVLGGQVGAAGKYFASITETALIKTFAGRLDLVDRQRMADVLEECKFQATDLCDSSRLGQLKKIEPVDTLVTGAVLRFGSHVQVTIKAIGVPDARSRGMENGRFALNADLAALFGESYYAPPALDGTRPQERQVVNAVIAPGRLHPLADPLSDSPYRAEVLVDSRPLPFHTKDEHLYIAAPAGQAYRVRLSNHSDLDAAVALLIDGLSSIGQHPQSPSKARKWVVKAGRTVEIRGWQLGKKVAREFVFTQAEASLAARHNYCDDIGLITAAFYPEKKAAGTAGRTRGAVGTGAGRQIRSEVRSAHLEYESTPAAVLSIHYDLPQIVEQMPGVEIGRTR